MRWYALCFLFLVAASVKGDLSIVGQVENSPYSGKDDLSSFFQTAEAPANADYSIVKRMTVAARWPERISQVHISDNAVISRTQVDGLVEGTDVLEVLGLENEVYFNGSTLKQIVGYRQQHETSSSPITTRTPSYEKGEDKIDSGKKQCYCHALYIDDSDENEDSDQESTGEDNSDEEGGEDSDGTDSDGVAFYAVLWVGGGIRDGEHNVIANKGKEDNAADERICLPGVTTNALSEVSTFCADCCLAAMYHGFDDGGTPFPSATRPKKNPKFYGPEGCPFQIAQDIGNPAFLDTCDIRTIVQSQTSFHFHLRELESLKMYSVITRSNDAVSFCKDFNRPSVNRNYYAGPLQQATCEDRVRSYVHLADGELEFMNSHDVALKSCHVDGHCGGEIQMRAAWPRFSGDGCHECLAQTNLAVTDLSVMTMNAMDTSRFCDLENTVHDKYLEKKMSKDQCNHIVRSFHENSGHVTRSTVDACSNVCSYSSMKPMSVNGRLVDVAPVSQIKEASFWDNLEML